MPGYLPYPVATAEPGLCGYKDNSEGALRRSGRPWRLTDGSFSDNVPAEQDELGRIKCSYLVSANRSAPRDCSSATAIGRP